MEPQVVVAVTVEVVALVVTVVADPCGLREFKKWPNLALVFFCFSIFILLANVCFCFVRFNFIQFQGKKSYGKNIKMTYFVASWM